MPPAVIGVVEAALLDGRADDEPAVAPRHQIGARRPQHVAQQRRLRIHPQRQHLPFDRPYRRTPVRGQPGDAARPGAGGQHHDIGGGDGAVLEHDARGAAALGKNFPHRTMLVDDNAGRLGGDAQRLRELAVVDLVILRREQCAGDFSRKMRFARARRRGREPFERQIEPALKLQPVRDLGLIVGRQGEHQRALLPQFDIDAARSRQLRGERRPARLAVAAERDQRLLARLGFATGRQHAGGGMACAHSRPGRGRTPSPSRGARAARRCQGRSRRRR